MYLVFLYYRFFENTFFQQIFFILEYFYKQIQNILLTKLYTTYKHKNILLTNKNYHI